MPLWEKLRRLFRRNDRPAPMEKLPTVVKPDVSKEFPGLNRHPWQHLFSKDQHIATMLNSITLSSDMKTLYLIDNGRAIPFDLTVPEGVVIGLLGEQLAVATAASKPADQEPDLPVDGGLGEGRAIDFGKAKASAVKASFKVTENSQYTLTYNEQEKALGIIGHDDVLIQLEAPDSNPCDNFFSRLDNNTVLRIRFKNNILEIR